MSSPPVQFDFGENWQEFSAHALTPERVAQARQNFATLIAPIAPAGLAWLDIGFGQGLGLLTAASLGARAVGCDINAKCGAVLTANLPHFPELRQAPPAVIGSILDEAVVAELARSATAVGGIGGYAVVHSWGVLHHTGDMRRAIAHAAGLVAPGGWFILAIYNRHWSSPAWWLIKRAYVTSPRWLQRAFIAALTPVIYAAKWLVTGKNPRIQERGMDFHYDVVDWVGGYPYEYASRGEVAALVEPLGFALEKFIPSRVPTGCNEFVFRRPPAPAAP